ncbi:MAG: SRPBCC domain-containing protein [Halioglobus sp.]
MGILQSPPGQDPVTLSNTFNASSERLFRAWTDAAELKKWFGPRPNSLVSVIVDLRVGGTWCFLISESAEKKVQLTGEYLKIESNKLLVFSWSHVEEYASGEKESTPFSQVTVRFTEVADGTKVDLVHENIVAEDGRLGVGRGWLACLTNLEEHCQQIREES